MNYEGAIALTVAVTVGIVQVIASIVTLVRVLRAEAAVEDVGRGLNGRLDLLLQEREARLRAEHAVEMERVRASALGGFQSAPRPEPRIVPIHPTAGEGSGGV